MKILRIISDTMVKGSPAFKGDTVMVDDADARLLIENKRAEICAEQAIELPVDDADPEKNTKRRK